jgi:hypothetical protein
VTVIEIEPGDHCKQNSIRQWKEIATVMRAYDVGTVVFCASDFSRNVPRAVGTFFNVPLLLRAVTRPDKGSVEVDGLINL